jgi:glutamine---fructose-6-phosphate transaminase (isomerizing)
VENAHPHRAGTVAVVHNGIIENFAELRAELAAAGLEPRIRDRYRNRRAADASHHMDQGMSPS